MYGNNNFKWLQIQYESCRGRPPKIVFGIIVCATLLMFGTDKLIWPKLMAYSIGIIQNADYLMPQQKREILYNNAARFLRMDAAQGK